MYQRFPRTAPHSHLPGFMTRTESRFLAACAHKLPPLALAVLFCVLAPIAGFAQNNCTPPAFNGNEAAWRAAYINWCKSNGGEPGNFSDSSGNYSGWGCHPGSQWKCGAGASSGSPAAQSTGSPVGDALNLGANLWI